MQIHNTKKLGLISDVKMKYALTPEQRAKVPRGEKVTFRFSKARIKGVNACYLYLRAEYNKLNPTTGKKHTAPAASRLLGIVWDEDPDWIYETDKVKSPIVARRTKAIAKKDKGTLEVMERLATMTEENLHEHQDVVLVKKIPQRLLLSVAILCSMRGLTDATSVANYWNENLSELRRLYPNEDLQTISHDTVRRVYMSLSEDCLKRLLKCFYEWLPKNPNPETPRVIAIDGQCDRSSRNIETDRPMMMINVVNVTSGRLCATHTLISTKRTEPEFIPGLIRETDVNGATVTVDALNTTREVALAIIGGGAHYLLALKENQKTLFQDAKELVAKALKDLPKKEMESRPYVHGRWESREYYVVPAKDLPQKHLDKWPGLDEGCILVARNISVRKGANRQWYDSDETRYFITNHQYQDGQITEWLGQCARAHWGVESFHWTMDALWGQDQMQCKHPSYLRARETIAKIGHNLLVGVQPIDQKERGLTKPQSERQLTQTTAVTLENGICWLGKLFALKDELAKAQEDE